MPSKVTDITTIPQGQGSRLNADQVDGINATTKPMPNCLVPLGPDGTFPNSVIKVASGGGPGFILGSGAPTDKNILIADGTDWESVALSGDATITANTGTLTLSNTAVTPGTYGDSTHAAQVTVDSKGRITAASTNPFYLPGGNNGDIQFNLSGTFGGNDNLFWDATNHRLGLGTTSPNYLLDVNGPLGVSGSSTAMVTSTLKIDYTTVARILSQGSVKFTLNTYASTGTHPYGICTDGTNVWVANFGSDSISKITQSGTITTYSIVAGSTPVGIAFDGTNLWTANFGNATVSKVSTGGSVIASYSVPTGPYNVAFDGTVIWSTNAGAHSVSKITLGGSVTTYVIPTVSAEPSGIAFDNANNAWVTDQNTNNIYKVTQGGSVSTYNVGFLTGGIAFDGTNMWIVNSSNGVTQIIPNGSAGTSYNSLGTALFGIIFDGTNLWCSDNGANAVIKVTLAGAATTYSPTGTGPRYLVYDGASVWTADFSNNSVTKVGRGANFGDIVLGGRSDTTENDVLYLDGTNQRAGVKTNSPAYTLDVNGTINASGAATLGSTLGVIGATTLSSTLGVTGAATFSGTIKVSGDTTGSTTCTLGTNSPSVGTTPQTWLKFIDSAGDTVYVPAYK